MTDLQVFKNEEFGQVRTVLIDNPTRRFWKIILAVLAVIVCAILLGKLPKPESYFTSVYWQG